VYTRGAPYGIRVMSYGAPKCVEGTRVGYEAEVSAGRIHSRCPMAAAC
jgi:hypothetical protein